MENSANGLHLVPDNIKNFMMTKQGDTTLLLAENCSKFNRQGLAEARIIVLSDNAFYLISQKKIHSKMKIHLMTYVIKSTAEGSNEVILCFKNDGSSGGFIDVHLSVDNRENFLSKLKT